MLFTSDQWLVLALVLVGGWLLGLASHPGGRKWKARYLAERDAHAGYRRDADTRASEYKTRSGELERENARLASAAPVTAATIRPADRHLDRPVHGGVTRATAAHPAFPAGERRGWFDWGRR